MGAAHGLRRCCWGLLAGLVTHPLADLPVGSGLAPPLGAAAALKNVPGGQNRPAGPC